MAARSITPAAPAFLDAVPHAGQDDDSNHAAHLLARARRVFVGGSRLSARWRDRQSFAVLETGFGIGANFLATWHAWRADPQRSQRLHYFAVETHPLRRLDLARVHAAWPDHAELAGLADLSSELVAAWPPLVASFHRLLLDEGRVTLTLVFGDIAECVAQIDGGAGFDAFFLVRSAPGTKPERWPAPLPALPMLLTRLGRLAAAQAMLVTVETADALRRGLDQAGFTIEHGSGDAGDMLVAHFAPRWPLPARTAVARSAIVIGAGLAGCSISERLCARGWNVSLVEQHMQPGQAISGNRAGIVMPLLSQDDNLSSRLARAAFLFALQGWRRAGGIGEAFDGAACGVLQVAASAEDALAQRNSVAAFGLAPEFAEWLDPHQINVRYGIAVPHGGCLFGQGGWVTPASLCHAWLAASGPRLVQHWSRDATRVEPAGDQWQVLDAQGAVIATAAHLIFANGNGASDFAQLGRLPLSRVRGQVTHVDAQSAANVAALPLVVCGAAYITPPVGGTVCIGATYDSDDDPGLRAQSQSQNLEALAHTLPSWKQALNAAAAHLPLSGRVGFRSVAPDRLPLAGTLPVPEAPINGSRLRDVPRYANLHCLLAYGSRGLIWAPFCAELLAASLEGEPLPIERDLAAALDPARFALKAHRRAGSG